MRDVLRERARERQHKRQHERQHEQQHEQQREHHRHLLRIVGPRGARSRSAALACDAARALGEDGASGDVIKVAARPGHAWRLPAVCAAALAVGAHGARGLHAMRRQSVVQTEEPGGDGGAHHQTRGRLGQRVRLVRRLAAVGEVALVHDHAVLRYQHAVALRNARGDRLCGGGQLFAREPVCFGRLARPRPVAGAQVAARRDSDRGSSHEHQQVASHLAAVATGLLTIITAGVILNLRKVLSAKISAPAASIIQAACSPSRCVSSAARPENICENPGL